MDKKKKVTQTLVTETVDHTTGEVTSTSSTKAFHFDREPEYIKMYVSDVARLNDVPAGMNEILMALISQMGYNNIIPALKPIKQAICNNLGISMNYLNKAIQTFYEKGLFIRVARGIYMADPELFARGKWEDIKQLRLVVEYKDDGKGKARKQLKSDLPDQVQLKLGI